MTGSVSRPRRVPRHPILPPWVRTGAALLRSIAAGGEEAREAIRFAEFRLVRHLAPVIAVDCGDVRFYVSTRDMGVGLAVFMRHGFYPEEMQNAVTVLERTSGHPFRDRERLFVDIGANIGTSCIQAIAHHGATGALAFEPDHENLKLLEQNLLANDLTTRVSVVEAAVTEHRGTVLLERSTDNDGDHRVRLRGDSSENRYGESERTVNTVPAVTLDSEIERGALDLGRVGLVSIDTQGHEAHVLAGAARLCASDVPVMLEYWPYGLRAAGGAQHLHEIVARSYKHYVDLAHPFVGERIDFRPADELAGLDEPLSAGGGHADILLTS